MTVLAMTNNKLLLCSRVISSVVSFGSEDPRKDDPWEEHEIP
jgi:hypothetical protein